MSLFLRILYGYDLDFHEEDLGLLVQKCCRHLKKRAVALNNIATDKMTSSGIDSTTTTTIPKVLLERDTMTTLQLLLGGRGY